MLTALVFIACLSLIVFGDQTFNSSNDCTTGGSAIASGSPGLCVGGTRVLCIGAAATAGLSAAVPALCFLVAMLF
jgi:hypothetical protein